MVIAHTIDHWPLRSLKSSFNEKKEVVFAFITSKCGSTYLRMLALHQSTLDLRGWL